MLRFREFLQEKIEGVAWQKTIPDLLWSENNVEQGYLPMGKQMLRRLGVTGETQTEQWAYHVTDPKGAKHVLKMQGSAKALSTMTQVTNAEMALDHFGSDGVGGIQTRGGVMIELSGDVVVAGSQDLMSAPDGQGSRWLDTTGVLGSMTNVGDYIRALESMMRDLYREKAKHIKKNVGDFYFGLMGLQRGEISDKDLPIPNSPFTDADVSQMEWMRKLSSEFSTSYLKGSGKSKADKVLVKYVRKFVGKMIGETFDLTEKFLRKHVDLLKSVISGDDGWTVWNEILLNKIKIKEVWIRGESEYHSMEDAEELSELIKKKGIKTHILSDADWDEELGYIFQDMEV